MDLYHNNADSRTTSHTTAGEELYRLSIIDHDLSDLDHDLSDLSDLDHDLSDLDHDLSDLDHDVYDLSDLDHDLSDLSVRGVHRFSRTCTTAGAYPTFIFGGSSRSRRS